MLRFSSRGSVLMEDQHLGGGPQFKPISSSTTVKYLIGQGFPGGPVVKEGFAFQGRQRGFQPLVGELRSHMLRGQRTKT